MYNILFVDDNNDYRKLVCKKLRKLHTVIEADSFITACEEIKKRTQLFDVAIVDIVLGDLYNDQGDYQGVSLAKLHLTDIPVIMISNATNVSMLKRTFERDQMLILSKSEVGSDTAFLELKIKEVIDLKSQRKTLPNGYTESAWDQIEAHINMVRQQTKIIFYGMFVVLSISTLIHIFNLVLGILAVNELPLVSGIATIINGGLLIYWQQHEKSLDSRMDQIYKDMLNLINKENKHQS